MVYLQKEHVKREYERQDLDYLEGIDEYLNLMDIVKEMKRAGMCRKADQEYVFSHNDFEGRNILVKKQVKTRTKEQSTNLAGVGIPTEDGEEYEWVISGIIDLDLASSMPKVLSRAPPTFLWFDNDKRTNGSIAWSGNNDTKIKVPLNNEELLIKGRFDHIMCKADPTCFEDAYERGHWLRSVARIAINGTSYYYDGIRYLNLIKEWKVFLDGCE